MISLLVIGDVVTDVLARHGDALEPGAVSDTRADISVQPGGSAANTAAWMASLGASVRLLASVGSDTGDWHRDVLLAAGVSPVLRVRPDQPTATIVVMVERSGERTMLAHRGAGALLAPDDWDDGLLTGVGHLHLSGYLLFTPSGRALADLATARARSRGLTVSVDPASTGFLRDFGPAAFVQATAGADVILPNLDEALLLTGETTAEAAALALCGSYGLAAVKMGAEGAVAGRPGRITARVPGASVTALDSTGAGDAFAAGFLLAHLSGADDDAALTAGCASGAAAVTRVSGRP
ncbi:carbohydrate kinase family protein [Actinocorallia longicatena]|uniref:PfkB family carbohydrate kinase n=1 Tax=Actinocorallia longicatena TaxID=111803 RepID=A0ABP6PWP7_9ACTN